MADNLYELLEVNETASPEAVAAAHRRLHQKFAEEAAAGDEDATNRLIALKEAYYILSDAERRRRYDQKLAAREAAMAAPAPEPRPFFKLLAVAALVGIFGIGYSKYQSEQELARLERERVAAEAKLAELAAQKEQEAKRAAEAAEKQRLRDEQTERYNRERDLAYARQVSRDLQYSEAQLRREKEREEQRRAAAEQQQKFEAERQLAKEKAYLRQLEAENQRSRYW